MARSIQGINSPRILVNFKKMNASSEQSNTDEHEITPRPLCKKRRQIYHSSDSDTDDEVSFWRAMRRKAWIDYEESDSSSESAVAFSQPQDDCFSACKVDPTREVLPVGIVRGCPTCHTCQKVEAKWRPAAGRRPHLAEAPVYFPDAEEFRDPFQFIASIRDEAEQFGICRIVPPRSWQPLCTLRDNCKLQQTFPTRVQQIHKLQVRESSGKVSQQTLKGEVTRNIERPTIMNSMLQVSEGVEGSSTEFGFEPGPDFTLDSFERYANDFKEHYFGDLHLNSAISNPSSTEPSLEMVEGEYWRIVEEPTEQIEVLYGADIETGSFGSGFPKVKLGTKTEMSEYETSVWNLNNIARGKGSVLAYEEADISGVIVPWLYVGMCFSSFCWHVEDHHFYSVNYMHWGSPKIWYGVPGVEASKLEDAMRKHLPDLFKEQPDLLHKLVTQLSPSLLIKEGVSVYRAVQRAGDFVVTFPRAYHSGFNSGFNCAEAVNIAPIDWLPHGQRAVELYRDLHRKASVSHDKLLFSVCFRAIQEMDQFQMSVKKNSPQEQASPESDCGYIWKKFCGHLGILTDAFKVRLEMECTRRASLAGIGTIKKMDMSFDASEERECINCRYDLHLSAVGCCCSPERYSCLEHVASLCACSWDRKVLLIRYELSELGAVLLGLEGQTRSLCDRNEQRQGECTKSVVIMENGSGEKFVVPQAEASVSNSASRKLSTDNFDLMNRRDLPIEVCPVTCGKETNHEVTCHEVQPRQVLHQLNRDSQCEVHKEHQEIASTVCPQSSHNYNLITSYIGNNSAERSTRSTGTSEGATGIKASFGRQFTQTELAKSGSFVQNSEHPCSCQQTLSEEILNQEHFLFDLNLTVREQKDHQKTSSKFKDSEFLPATTPKLLDPSQISHSLQHRDVGLVECRDEQSSPSDLIVLSDDDGEKSDGEEIGPAKGLNSNVETGLCLGRTDGKSLAVVNTRETVPVKEGSGTCLILEKPVRPEQIEDLEYGARLGHVNVNHDLNLPGEHAYRLSQESATQNSFTMVGYNRHAAPSVHARSDGKGLPEVDRHVPPKTNGPRIAKIVHSRKATGDVELIDVGALVLRENWYDEHMIYPSGFKCRTSFYSFLNFPKRCYYISEILDTGMDRPYFKVTSEDCASEVFISSSSDLCWREVQNRIDTEISHQESLGCANLASLHNLERILGFEMFGFTSPAIIQAVEALDPEHHCVNYWRAKQMERHLRLQHQSHDFRGEVRRSGGQKRNVGTVSRNDPLRDNIGCLVVSGTKDNNGLPVDQRTRLTSLPDRRNYDVLRRLFKKGTPSELWTLLSVFRSDWGGKEWKEGCQALTDELEHILEARR